MTREQEAWSLSRYDNFTSNRQHLNSEYSDFSFGKETIQKNPNQGVIKFLQRWFCKDRINIDKCIYMLR